MKVAHITKHMRVGGIPVYVSTLIQALREKNIDTILISSGGEVAEHLAGKTPSYIFDLDFKFEFHFKIFLVLPRIISILKREKVDLIHAHTRVGKVLAAMIHRLTGIPYVTTVHGFYKRRLSRILFPCWGARAIAISPAVRDSLVHLHKVKSSRIATILNGIDLRRFSPKGVAEAERKAARTKLGLSSEQFIVAMVVRMIEQKGGRDFISALGLLAARGHNVYGLLVGEGADRITFEQLIKNKGLEKRIRCVGRILDVKTILDACDAFVHPVRVEEGFGLSIAEAMAAGLPVVVTDQWALWPAMESLGVGVKVPVQRPDLIADAIEEWILSPVLLNQAGANALKVAHEQFDLRKMADSVIQVYRETLRFPT